MKKLLVYTLVAIGLSLLTVALILAQAPEPAALNGEQCKACHAEQYDQWAATAHPKSVEAVKSSDHASEDCLHCMSTDYRYDETLTVETFQFGVTCLACHAPHDTPGDAKPTIADVSAVCKDCHNAHLEEGAAEFEAGNTARHPSKEMMAGLGAIGVASTPSKHDMACNTCHLEGHRYEPAQSACDACHGGEKTIEGVAALFAPRLEELAAMETLQDDYPAAYTNFTMLSNDKSNGVHNPAYALAVLNAINSPLGESPAAVTPVELPATGGKIANFLALAVTGSGLVLTLLGAGMALIGRRRR
jgi:predicted CXXCH cytochrome family protein